MTYPFTARDPNPDDLLDPPWWCPGCRQWREGERCEECDSSPASAAPEDERRPLSDSSPVTRLEEASRCNS